MTRSQLQELHFITPIENVKSILELGILSHVRATELEHRSIAMDEIQRLRANVIVPGTARKLHEYANLYICGRNPMLFTRRFEKICVLGVSTEVLDLPGVIVTDKNASSGYVSFRPAPDGLSQVSRDLTFAEDWRDDDQIQYWRKKAAKCAEVLVPNRVDSRWVLHAYVGTADAEQLMTNLATRLVVKVDSHLFFR